MYIDLMSLLIIDDKTPLAVSESDQQPEQGSQSDVFLIVTSLSCDLKNK